MTGVVRTGAATLIAVHPPEDPAPTTVARQAIAVPGAAGAPVRDPRRRERVRRGDGRHERRADHRGGTGEPDTAKQLATGNHGAVGREPASAAADDQRRLQQAEALELPHGVDDIRFPDLVAETPLRRGRDLADRGVAVAAAEDDRRQRLQAVRLLRVRVIDHGLVPDRLDQQPIRTRRRNCDVRLLRTQAAPPEP
jgi:hypothetical protein